MDTPTRRVIIVGGGSAGWITAARMAARYHNTGADAVRVTLVESASIETIGVGEGTWPTMRNTLRKAGIAETDFLRSCDAAFKQGAKFIRWTDGTDSDGYYHPLNPPQGAPGINLSRTLGTAASRQSAFADCVDFQSTLCEAGQPPKFITTPEYGAVANYAYHLDAVKFAALLRTHAVGKLGVDTFSMTLVNVVQAGNGDIQSITLQRTARWPAIFLDCTGFAALLIGKTLRCAVQKLQRYVVRRPRDRDASALSGPDTPSVATPLRRRPTQAGYGTLDYRRAAA